MEENKETSQVNQLTQAVATKELEIQGLKHSLDSISSQQTMARQVFRELRVQTPEIASVTMRPSVEFTDSTSTNLYIASIRLTKRISTEQKQKIEDWLKVRLQTQSIKLFFEE